MSTKTKPEFKTLSKGYGKESIGLHIELDDMISDLIEVYWEATDKIPCPPVIMKQSPYHEDETFAVYRNHVRHDMIHALAAFGFICFNAEQLAMVTNARNLTGVDYSSTMIDPHYAQQFISALVRLGFLVKRKTSGNRGIPKHNGFSSYDIAYSDEGLAKRKIQLKKIVDAAKKGKK